MSKWMDNAMNNGEHILVDLGYVNAKETRENADKLKAKGIGKRNFEMAGFGRLLVEIPPTKIEKLMSEFPIKTAEERPGYSWCTHTWIEGDGDNLDFAWGRHSVRSS